MKYICYLCKEVFPEKDIVIEHAGNTFCYCKPCAVRRKKLLFSWAR